ncbi:triacylglycerol lipase [Coprinopsis cinerea okayama7|uniref:GPI inositol-deacylase n=1 Tax=Coprinopsis cinerea (strain Okayama-7 / 130 / ATCC MYA-4618 / FGSC 9003) TaxID=240176 RepID=A8N2C4_COPC7|nr:triacylglycerol lipase [Coprinopsis cinerea okayama7\|eukprot:XP_001829084.1 triacylglycerol lipase [Coprinopsis cinerea okayama7\
MPRPKSRPVLRWLTGPISSSPPSPDLRSLSEAMTEPITPPPPIKTPTPPPLARLPPSFRPSKNLTRPPPFLVDGLTRTTLPTSSLSPPLPVSSSSQPTSVIQTPKDVQKPPPIVLNHSSLTRSSLDSLRSVQTRTFSGGCATSLHSVQSLDVREETGSTVQRSNTRTSTVASSSSSTTAAWWWFQTDTNKDHLLSEEDQADGQQAPAQQEKRKYTPTANPVVFCHGLLGFDSVKIGPAIAPLEVTHWRGIKEVLEANGTEVLITRVPATSSPVDRAKVLEERINAVYPGRSVHLIGHSMGGLDCRYLTTHLTDRKFKVLSVTTIATPHRGSSFADHFLYAVGKHRLPQVLALLDLLPNGGGDGKAFEFLTLESMKKFNEDTPDVEGVKYFSWGAVYEPGLIDTWKYPHSVILEREGPNDGLVSIESAKWGTYLGTLSQVNHLDLVGWINEARYKWAEIMGKEIKFRPATFYLGIVDMLAKEVEGHIDASKEQTKRIEEQADGVKAKDGDASGSRGAGKGDFPPSPTTEQQHEREVQGQMVESLDIAGGKVEGADAKGKGRTPRD